MSEVLAYAPSVFENLQRAGINACCGSTVFEVQIDMLHNLIGCLKYILRMPLNFNGFSPCLRID
jgi:hypothetical protein